jgi:hypothetical protein
MKRPLSVPEKHQEKIALATLKMSGVGASIMGGMDHREAIQFLRSINYRDDDLTSRLRIYGHDTEAILKFMS